MPALLPLPEPVTFRVLGVPSPQAGTKSVPTKTKDGATVYRKITEGGAGLLGWRQDVAKAANEHAERLGMFTGPVRVQVEFRFAMPPSRAARIRRLGRGWHTVKPDADKLMRAINDALKSGGLLKDDALVAAGSWRKIEVVEAWTGATIKVSALAEDEA